MVHVAAFRQASGAAALTLTQPPLGQCMAKVRTIIVPTVGTGGGLPSTAGKDRIRVLETSSPELLWSVARKTLQVRLPKARLKMTLCIHTLRVLLVAAMMQAMAPKAAVAQFLFVGSLGDSSVKRYDGRTGAFIETFVAPASGGLRDPEGLAMGPDGNLYVSSFGDVHAGGRNYGAVLRYSGSTGALLGTFVPPNTNQQIGFEGLQFGPDGNLYVTGWFTNSILRYDGRTGAALGAFASGHELLNPYSFTFGPEGDLYVASTKSNRILRYSGATGAFIDTFVPSVPDNPNDLTFGPDGDLFVSIGDFGTQVLRYDGQSGAFVGVFASGGGLFRPRGLRFGPDGDLYVSSFGSSEVLRYDGNSGAFLGAFVPAGSGGLAGSRFLLFTSPALSAVPEASSAIVLLLGGVVLSGLGWHSRRRAAR